MRANLSLFRFLCPFFCHSNKEVKSHNCLTFYSTWHSQDCAQFSYVHFPWYHYPDSKLKFLRWCYLTGLCWLTNTFIFVSCTHCFQFEVLFIYLVEEFLWANKQHKENKKLYIFPIEIILCTHFLCIEEKQHHWMTT